MYSNIKVYQKYLVTSIKVGCATRSLYASSGPKAEGVPIISIKQNRESTKGYSRGIQAKLKLATFLVSYTQTFWLFDKPCRYF